MMHFYRDPLINYRELRLQSLKSDPESFSSTFASESGRPVNFWTNRMLRPGARHLLAVELSNHSGTLSVADEPQAILESKWVGMLVLLGPNSVAGNVTPYILSKKTRIPGPAEIARLIDYHVF